MGDTCTENNRLLILGDLRLTSCCILGSGSGGKFSQIVKKTAKQPGRGYNPSLETKVLATDALSNVHVFFF